jgi:hypothetical protein
VTEVVGLVAMTEVFRTSCVVDVLCVCCVIQSDGGDGVVVLKCGRNGD